VSNNRESARNVSVCFLLSFLGHSIVLRFFSLAMGPAHALLLVFAVATERVLVRFEQAKGKALVILCGLLIGPLQYGPSAAAARRGVNQYFAQLSSTLMFSPQISDVVLVCPNHCYSFLAADGH